MTECGGEKIRDTRSVGLLWQILQHNEQQCYRLIPTLSLYAQSAGKSEEERLAEVIVLNKPDSDILIYGNVKIMLQYTHL